MFKSDLILPNVPAPITIGQKVVFIDGSFTLSILNDSHELKPSYTGLSNDIWTVIATNVTCPSIRRDENHILSTNNNCIVKE